MLHLEFLGRVEHLSSGASDKVALLRTVSVHPVQATELGAFSLAGRGGFAVAGTIVLESNYLLTKFSFTNS